MVNRLQLWACLKESLGVYANRPEPDSGSENIKRIWMVEEHERSHWLQWISLIKASHTHTHNVLCVKLCKQHGCDKWQTITSCFCYKEIVRGHNMEGLGLKLKSGCGGERGPEWDKMPEAVSLVPWLSSTRAYTHTYRALHNLTCFTAAHTLTGPIYGFLSNKKIISARRLRRPKTTSSAAASRCLTHNSKSHFVLHTTAFVFISFW